MAMTLNRGDRGSAIPTELKFGEPYFIPGTGLFIGDEAGVPEKVSGSENLGAVENTVENTVKEYVNLTETGFLATHSIKKLISIKAINDSSGILGSPKEFPLSHFIIFGDNLKFKPINLEPGSETVLNPKNIMYVGPTQVMMSPLPNGETILLVEYVPEISETFDTEIDTLMGVVSADTINFLDDRFSEKNNSNGYFQFFPPVTNATYEWILTFPDLSEVTVSTSADRFFAWLVKDFNDIGTLDTAAIYKLRGKMVWNGLEFESNNFEFSVDLLLAK